MDTYEPGSKSLIGKIRTSFAAFSMNRIAGDYRLTLCSIAGVVIRQLCRAWPRNDICDVDSGARDRRFRGCFRRRLAHVEAFDNAVSTHQRNLDA